MIVSVILANVLYEYVANQKCEYESLYECIDNFLMPNLAFDLISMAICALVFTVVIWQNLAWFCNRRFRCQFLVVLLLFLNISILVATNTTITKQEFGGMYGVAFVLMLLLFSLILCCRTGFKRVYPHLSKRSALFAALLFFIFSKYLYQEKIVKSCRNWERGLHGSLVNSSQYCQIDTPPICFYEISDRIQDFSFWDCSRNTKDIPLMQKVYHT